MRWWWSFNSMVVLLYIYAFLYAVQTYFFFVCSKPTHFSDRIGVPFFPIFLIKHLSPFLFSESVYHVDAARWRWPSASSPAFQPSRERRSTSPTTGRDQPGRHGARFRAQSGAATDHRLHGQQPHRGREQSARLVGVEEPDPRRPVYKTHEWRHARFQPELVFATPTSLEFCAQIRARERE